MIDLLVQGCDILRLDRGQTTIELNQDIAIRDGIINQVTSAGSINPANAKEVLPAKGLLAVPGLANTHAHVPMVLFRGLVEDVTLASWFNDYIFPLESNLTPEDVYWGALLGIAEMIESGITAVADHYFFMDQVAEAVRDSGMRANLVWAVFGHEGEEKLNATVDFVRRWQGVAGGRIVTWLGPHAPYTTGPDFLRLSAKKARELGVGIHIHVSETLEQVQLSLREYGVTPVRMLKDTGVLDVPTILAHCLFPTDEDIQILADAPTGIAQAPKTYMKAGMGTAPLNKLRATGIPIGLASDGAASNNTLDLYEQARLLALTQKHLAQDPTVMPVGEVLEIAFHGGWQVLRMGDRVGDLQTGKLADIALLRQDGVHVFPRYSPAANLVYSSRASDVDTVICAGKVLMRERQLLTIDKARVKQEIAQRLERLNQRVPGRRIAFYPA
ncbi:MAG: amidohydrolase [Anaerolineales bacterium]|jgi:5-methylthioadenosine/S-adenosylhomocysteine deaminase